MISFPFTRFEDATLRRGGAAFKGGWIVNRSVAGPDLHAYQMLHQPQIALLRGSVFELAFSELALEGIDTIREIVDCIAPDRVLGRQGGNQHRHQRYRHTDGTQDHARFHVGDSGGQLNSMIRSFIF
jgi:hypothetical protein